MKKTPSSKSLNVSRRKFIVGTAAASGGLALGFRLPFGSEAYAQSSRAADSEINAWVVVKPDDTCVIRIARDDPGRARSRSLPSRQKKFGPDAHNRPDVG